MDPETNLYFAKVRRRLNQTISFKCKIGKGAEGNHYELSTIYDTDRSAYVNNELKRDFGSICDANYDIHNRLCHVFSRFKNKTLEHIRAVSANCKHVYVTDKRF